MPYKRWQLKHVGKRAYLFPGNVGAIQFVLPMSGTLKFALSISLAMIYVVCSGPLLLT
jgi:hypothetical protein